MGCACQGGYTGRFCDSEIDACEMNGQPCYGGVKCTDLPPPANVSGYKCGLCPSGYTGDGAQCTDFDECQSNLTNRCEQLCVNVPESFFCDCRHGYRLNADGATCEDINECEPTNDCMQQCINTEGSYNCSCNQDFKTDPADRKKCKAKKNCSSDHGCEHVCFKGSNNKPSCACFANYELDKNGKNCRDIDECDSNKPLHRCNMICQNTPGSYNCSCEKGFKLSKNGYDCEDINECLDEDMYNCTDDLHKCVNTRGSYKCVCERGLYFINGTCRGLAENETIPIPTLPPPRLPSKEEKAQAVQILVLPNNTFQWDFKTDEFFKETIATVTSSYCTENRTECALVRRKRHDLFLDLYIADQVHLLPGYPSNSSRTLLVVFYVQQPLGLYIANSSVLPWSALLNIVQRNKSDIETAIGAKILHVEAFFKPTTSPTSDQPVEPTRSSDYSKWIIIIGVGVGTVLILTIAIVIMCKKRRKKLTQEPVWSVPPEEDAIVEMSEIIYNNAILDYETTS